MGGSKQLLPPYISGNGRGIMPEDVEDGVYRDLYRDWKRCSRCGIQEMTRPVNAHLTLNGVHTSMVIRMCRGCFEFVRENGPQVPAK